MGRGVPAAAEVERVVARLRARGLDAVWVDRAPVYDKATLLHALYQALPLTADFGFNWDALADALYGPEDPAAPPRVLVFRDLALLEEREPTTARTLLEIVRTVAADPASTLYALVRAGEDEPLPDGLPGRDDAHLKDDAGWNDDNERRHDAV